MSKPKKRKPAADRGWLTSPWMGGLLWTMLGLLLGVLLLNGRYWPAAHVPPDSFLAPLLGDADGNPIGRGLAWLMTYLTGGFAGWLLPLWMVTRGFQMLLRPEQHWLPVAGRLVAVWATGAVWLALIGDPAAAGASTWGVPAHAVADWTAGTITHAGALVVSSFLLLTALIWMSQPWLPPFLHRLFAVFLTTGRYLAAVGRLLGHGLRLLWRAVCAVGNVWLQAYRSLRGVKMPRRKARRKKKKAPGRRIARPAAATDDETEAGEIEEFEDEAVEDGFEPDQEPDPEPEPRRLHRPKTPAPAAASSEASNGQDDEAPRTKRTRGGGSVSTATRAVDDQDFPEEQVGLAPEEQQAIELPDPELLADGPESQSPVSEEELNASADLLEDTLKSFGVEGAVKDVRPGPVVTTFEYQPASGVRVNAIVQRSDDLALAMKARSIRMEAPIPGKAAVGIEIPNPLAQIVALKDVYLRATDGLDKPLSVVLGQDVFGEPVAIDLAAQPHLLVAGSTGSGKSVCINAMITSMLLRCDPSVVRLMLIDPKMLELNAYNEIPHLLLPVITDPKEALRALKWLEAQMDHRYKRLAKHSVRNIEGYNRKVAAGEVFGADGELVKEPLPYFVCIVDELADLMVQLGQEIEIPITRIAQKARAVGIHLVLATQRPSVDVLTGVIKANIPCRIAFRVIQKNDSRTILDANGAEQLLGRGDMLYLQPGRAQPRRVHGAFVDVDECEAVAGHWRAYKDVSSHVSLGEETQAESGVGGPVEDDPLFDKAREVIVYSQHGSTSSLQRKLGVGYARAGRLMDLLERAGVVGPFVGSKARDVLMKPDDLQALEAAEGADPE